MSIPKLPPFYNMNYTTKEGNLTDEALNHNDQTFQSLNELLTQFNQLVISNLVSGSYVIQGFTNPSATTAEITVYRDNDDVPVGTVWFNTSTSKLQVKTAIGSPGTIETITSS